MKKIVIIGAGHNGLVCAAYLAKAGYHVSVYERNSILGGAARTDETTFPGYKISSCSYVNALMQKKVVKELNLAKYGYEILPRDPSFLKVLPDGRYLSLGSDEEENIRQIAKFSERDAQAFSRYNSMGSRLGEFFDQFILESPPRGIFDMAWLRGALRVFRLGPVGAYRLMHLCTTDAREVLAEWFESDVMRGAFLPDSTIGATNFSGLILILHEFMGDAGGARGVWGYQRGGMGGISKAIAKAAEDLGVKIHLSAPVEQILIDGERAYGILLESGKVIQADMVISNATPHVTYSKLIDEAYCPPSYMHRVHKDDYTSGVMKINAILSGLPKLKALAEESDPARLMKGTIHISPTVKYIEEALEYYSHGIPSRFPMIEMTIPSIVDDTLAPQGHHVMNLFVQYVPYKLMSSGGWSDSAKQIYFERSIKPILRNYIDNIDEILIDAQILAPPDIEREVGLTGGNIFHGAMKWNQLGPLRHPYKSPIADLWNCGSGTHPGGGVSGAPGHNAAQEILRSLRK